MAMIATAVLFISVTSVPDSFADPTVFMDKGIGADFECDEKCYSPSVSYVAVGEKIVFINNDSMPHTVTNIAQDGVERGDIFDSGMMLQFDSADISVDRVGEYPYLCELHPWMTGVINVVDFTKQDLKNGTVETISEKLKVSNNSVKPYLIDAFSLFIEHQGADITVSDYITAVMWFENKQ